MRVGLQFVGDGSALCKGLKQNTLIFLNAPGEIRGRIAHRRGMGLRDLKRNNVFSYS